MPTVRAALVIRGSVHQAQQAWCDTARWPAWVEGFARLDGRDPNWPQPGAVATWSSGPAGRGRVTERILAFEPLEGVESAIEDDQLDARQVARFAVQGEGETLLSVDFAYRLKRRSPLTPVLDLLFVRRAMQAWLRSTLNRFAGAAADAGQKASRRSASQRSRSPGGWL